MKYPSIRPYLQFIVTCAACLVIWANQVQAQVPKVIFDSDMSSDWDDIGDIAVLHGLANLGECEIIAMMGSATNGSTPLCMDAINTFYGRPNIPIGIRAGTSDWGGGYAAQIAAEFPHGPETVASDFPQAVSLYRQVLAAQPDKSVIIVTVGYLNNLEALMKSGPDQFSTLNGMDLIRQKVKLWSCVGGNYPLGNEYNFAVEHGATFYVVNNWPTAVTCTPEVFSDIRTAGRLVELPANNPIRRVYVDIQQQPYKYPYPAWGQIGIYEAIRADEGFWGKVNVGHNTANAQGANFWITDYDPVAPDDQAYLLQNVRLHLNRALDALMMSPPLSAAPSIPVWPTNLRVTSSGGPVNLQWTDNSYNETGFVIERKSNGVFTQIGSVGANVKTFVDTAPGTHANLAYRVSATNSVGRSESANGWLYSGWTETNFTNPSNLPLYNRHSDSDMRAKPAAGDAHVTVNNDSTHGSEVKIDVCVGSLSAYGAFHIYFFYQNPDNWYRLSVDSQVSRFEKRIAGVTSQVGYDGPGVKIGETSSLERWQVGVTAAGRLTFNRQMPYASAFETDRAPTGPLLSVPETLSLTSGKIGLGGYGRLPIWEGFNFDSAPRANDAVAPSPPQNLLAAVRSSRHVDLSWSAATDNVGVTGYEVIRDGVTIGVTSGTSYTDIGLSPAATYSYQVRAFDAVGNISAMGTEVSAVVPPGSGVNLLNASFETPVVNNYAYNPAGSGWSFTNFGGIQHDGSDYGAVASPEGVQTALVQGKDGTLGSMSQTAYFAAGTYKIAFYAARKDGIAQPIAVNLDGDSIGTYGASSNNFELITTSQFQVAAGNHTISFSAVDGSGDKTCFIDLVSVELASSGGSSAPPSPGNLTAAAGNSQVVLNWGAVSGATSYNIYRGTSSGGQSATPIATGVTSNGYTNTGLSNGTIYYYKVAAVNASGTSGLSNEASAQPSQGGGSPPAAPGGLTASPGDSSVTLNWSTVSGAASYNVYRGTSSGGQGATPIATGITTHGYTNTGLSNGTAYFYKVAAVNSSGTSTLSNEASATPASAGGGGTVAVTNGSFETPSVIDYSYSPAGSGWTFSNYAGIQRNGSAYWAQAAPEGVQTALLQGYANTVGSMSQTISFAAGNYVINFQAARRYGAAQPVKVSVGGVEVGTYTPASNSFEGITTAAFTIPTAGNYVVTLAATDPTGDKTTFIDLLSIAASGGSGGTAPAAPTGLTATAGNAQVSLSWTASEGAASYNVYRGTSAGGEGSSPVAMGITETAYTDQGLNNGTTYYYKVAAVNNSGVSANSNEASATPAAGGGNASFTNPSFETPAVGSYSYTPAGSGWTFTSLAGIQQNGSAYSWEGAVAPDGTQTAFVQGAGASLGTMSQGVSFSTAGSYTISFKAARRYGAAQPVQVRVDGVVVGTYTPGSDAFETVTTEAFTVTAGSHTVTFAATDGTSDKTTFIDQVSLGVAGGGGGSVPAAPTGLSAAAGNGQAVLSWTVSAGAQSYNIYRGTSAGGQSTTPIATGITGNGYTNTGLSNGTTYYYKVAAVNASGVSNLSNEASVTPTNGSGGTVNLVNRSFESPSVENFSYNPAGSGWTFTNYAGVQRNGSSYTYGVLNAPDGVQTALLQGYANTLGTMSQTVNLSAGTYSVTFRAARRFGSVQPVKVKIGESVVGTYTPSGDSFEQITTAGFTITAAGSYVLSFEATDSSGDKTTFIDLISIDTQ